MIFGSLEPVEEALRRAMHEAGYSDYQIAKDLDRTTPTIQKWRASRGLPAHFRPGTNTRKRPETVAMTPEMKVLFLKLLRRNVGARLIAAEWGVSVKTLELWRTEMLAAEPELRRPRTSPRRRPRHPSGRAYSRLRPDRRRRAFELYADGLSDQEIAVAMEINRQQVGEWRNAFFLAPNFEPGWGDYMRQRRPAAPSPVRRPPPVAISPRSNPIYALMADAVGRGISPDLADDVISDMWIALEEGKLALHEIAAAAKRYRGKVIGSFASRFGPRSLDEDLSDGEGFKLLDLLRDDRSSPWLEKMGATVW